METTCDIEALMRPFEGSQVRQRMGPGRKPLDYISGPDVIRRLLDATGNCFSWNVEKVQLITQETANGSTAFWVVTGVLSLGELGVRSGVGTHPAEGVEAAKAAETDALKRAAVKFGVGLHLYEEEPGNGSGSGSGSGSGNGSGTASASSPPPPPGNGNDGYGRSPSGPVRSGSGNGYGSNAMGTRRSASRDGVGQDAPF